MRMFDMKIRGFRDATETEIASAEKTGGKVPQSPRREPGDCAGCGGEKFVAHTPDQIEAVLRDHISTE